MHHLLMVNSTKGGEICRISCGGGDADYYLCGYIFTDGDCLVMTAGFTEDDIVNTGRFNLPS
jgi:hypothetical protein